MQKQPIPTAGWYLWLILVALSPISTKVAGTAWGMAGAWALWLAATHPRQEAQTAATQALYRATTAILWCFGVAFAARTIGQLYWADGWEYRHFDARMLSIAVSLHIVVRRVTFSASLRKELVIALSLAGLVALYTTYRSMHGQSTPTNIIPWAYGMALFAVVLATVRLVPKETSRDTFVTTRWLAPIGALILSFAVLLIGVRGSYFAVLWVLCTLLYSLRHGFSWQQLAKTRVWLGFLAVGIALGVLIIAVPKLYETPKQRISLALAEIKGFKSENRNTSVGLRLHFAEKGINAALQHPWIGIGIEQRITLVNEWSVGVNKTLVDMDHSHNEYLNAMLDYGSMGALATLAYLLGLLLSALYLRASNPVFALCLAGLGFTTFTTFLTNANTLHNYSSVTLGLAMFFAVVLFSRRLAPQP